MKTLPTLIAISALISSTALLAGPLPVSDSGLVTVIPGQDVQLNVVNLGPSGSSCAMILSLIDASGATLLASPETILEAGASVPLPLPVVADTTLRAHIDYSPQLIAQAELKDPMSGCYNLLPTLEVIDVTGTRVVLSNFVGIPSTTSSSQSKITICHKPGKLDQAKEIPLSAWGGHHGHGDTLGDCAHSHAH